MVGGIVGSLITSLMAASADRHVEDGKPIRRAYYGLFIKILVALPLGLFLIFAIGGLANMMQGYSSAWQILAIGLGGFLLFGWLIAREFINLISYSTGISSASRVVRAADDLLRELLLLAR